MMWCLHLLWGKAGNQNTEWHSGCAWKFWGSKYKFREDGWRMGGLFAEGEQTRANKPYFTAKTQPNNKQMNVYVVDNNVRVDKRRNQRVGG